MRDVGPAVAVQFLTRTDPSVAQVLAIALSVTMAQERNQVALLRLLPEVNQAIQAVIPKGAFEKAALS